MQNQDKYITKLEEKVKKLKELVVLDPLTKVLNRRGLEDQLDILESMYKRYSIDYFVSFVDIDDFKHINDTKGHIYGDEVLYKISQSIKNNIRVSDIVARVGGDEFMVCFHAPKHDDFSHITQILFQKIENECDVSLSFVTARRSNFENITSLLSEIDSRFIIKKQHDI